MKEKIKTYLGFLLALIAMILFLIYFYMIISKNYNEKTNEKINENVINGVSLEHGKKIGRTAMIYYMIETIDKGDTLNIDLNRLLEIEDSIQKDIKNDIKY